MAIFIFICLLGVAFVLAVILKIVAGEKLKDYSSVGLALRIILFLIGIAVIVGLITLAFN